MLLRFKVLAFFAGCIFLTWPAAANDAEAMAEVEAAVIAIEKAFTDRDLATIKSMLAEDHMSVATRYGGAVHVDEQFETIDTLKRKTFDLTPLDIDMFADHAARVTFEQSYSGTFDGKPLPPRVFVTQIWLRRDGKWLQSLYQETPITLPQNGNAPAGSG